MRTKRRNTKTRPSASVNNATAQTTEDYKTSEPESKRSRVAVETEKRSEPSSGATKTVEDWRQNSAVLESICDHLPLKALKSVRLVSKNWAIAGAVALSHKCVVTQGFRGFTLKKIEEHLNVFQRNPVLQTGFRLRHVHLQWSWMTNLSPSETNSLLKSWLALFRSEEFQLVTSLKIEDCPSQVISKFLLSDVLPTCWRKLKSLVFPCQYSFTSWVVVAPFEDSEKLADFPELELEELEMYVDNDPRVEYNWNFLEKCSKLKKLKFVVREHVYPGEIELVGGNEDFELEIHRLSYTWILSALQGKELISLNLRFVWKTMAEGELNPMSVEIMSFGERLILMNQQTLQDLQISVDTLPANIQPLFQNFPLAPQLQRLKSFKIKCASVNLDAGNPARLSPFYEVLSVLRTKGYLEMENFCLIVNEQNHKEETILVAKISIASEKSARFAIKYKGEISDLAIHLPQGFEAMMQETFPTVNYLCMPKQLRRRESSEERVVTRTAIFEKLGRSGVFNVPFGLAQWKSLETLKAPENKAYQQFWNMCFKDVADFRQFHDSKPVTSNTVAKVKLNWAGFENDSNSALFVFDSIPDLKKAWAKFKTSNCCWSVVEEDEVGPDDQVSAVCCRMFESIKQPSC